MFLWRLLPSHRWSDPGKKWKVSWLRLIMASLVLMVMSFSSVSALLNAQQSPEEKFVEACSKLNGFLIRDDDGLSMRPKALCIHREALLGWLKR